MGGVPGEPAGANADAGVDPHYYIEDHEDGTLRGDPGRYDRQPILPVTAFDARNGMDNGDEASTLQRKGSLNAEPLLMVPEAEAVAMRGREGGSQAEMTGLPNLRGHTGKDGGGHDGFVLVPDEAATLTKGSANAGVSAPGRHKEDDENLVVYEVVPGDIRHHGPNTLQAKEVSEAATLGASDAKKSDRGTLVAEGFAQGHQGQISHFDEEVPAITAGGETVRNNSPMVYSEENDVVETLRSHPRPGSATPGAIAYSKAHGAADTEDSEKWQESEAARTLNSLQHATDVVVETIDGGDVTHTLSSEGADASEDGTGRGTPLAFESRYARNGRGAPSDEVPPLKAQSGETGKGDGAPLVMAVSENQRRELRESDHAPSLGEPSGHMGQGLPSVRSGSAVRRLTPTECERLQGFPDGWTALDGPDTPDGPRYAALGDAVTVNVARWVIARLVKRERLRA